MFVVLIDYKKSLDDVDENLEEHVGFLKKYYAEGVFLASGRKVPRSGGVILARCESSEKLREILKEDPFYREKIADYEVTEFVPSMTCEELSSLK